MLGGWQLMARFRADCVLECVHATTALRVKWK